MRRVFEDRDDAQERARRGREAVRGRQSLEQAAAFLAKRVPELEKLRIERGARETPASRAALFLAEGPSLSWNVESWAGPFGRLWRRLLMRALRPYTVRQRELENLLVNGLDELERSRDRLEDTTRELKELVAELGRRVDELDRP
jgi:hypothetical protein